MERRIMGIPESDIIRYWGSIEAFVEEQRRFGLLDLEALPVSVREQNQADGAAKLSRDRKAVDLTPRRQRVSIIKRFLLRRAS
jgi:hypothetical protein